VTVSTCVCVCVCVCVRARVMCTQKVLSNNASWQNYLTSTAIVMRVFDYSYNSVAPEPEGSSPHSQQPANGSYPKPGESTPHPPNQFP
jgi:hypothetical protein